ncbi:MAG: hypothetical protein A3H42_01790 [Deltaproteobacteria bacterium RIFCSPLOWO2_02_FULL_46_8]|nr:MAG: hypothetical protein A3H42_01790 [Deltaproteobacteria bacterium RIFCSPLOWO2_02_FULL_46_8]
MDKTVIKQVLLDQKAEIGRIFNQPIIEREKLPDATRMLTQKMAKVITGIRRCGKSVLAHQMLKNCSYAYINFDDERLAAVHAEDLNDFLETAKEITPDFNHLLLDEIQNTSGWELFVNRLLRNDYNVIITGSNSHLLSKELATHLTGRHLSLELFPFSFREFLLQNGISAGEDDFFKTDKRAEFKMMLERYIQEGGFPEVQKMDLKENYLRELFDKIITKDIVMRYNIKYGRDLKEMALYLLSNFASRAAYHKIKNIFEVKSVHTIKNYFEFLEESYLLFGVNAFSFKLKEQIRKPKKIYAIDTGLINAIVPKISLNIGRLMENTVFLELKRRGMDVYYYTDGHCEVDFVIKDGLKIKKMIQVCYSIESLETKEREIKSLVKAQAKLECQGSTVITWDTEGDETVKNTKIQFIPLWKWLLCF